MVAACNSKIADTPMKVRSKTAVPVPGTASVATATATRNILDEVAGDVSYVTATDGVVLEPLPRPGSRKGREYSNLFEPPQKRRRKTSRRGQPPELGVAASLPAGGESADTIRNPDPLLLDNDAPSPCPDAEVNVGVGSNYAGGSGADSPQPGPQTGEDAANHRVHHIPCGINDLSLLESARFFRDSLGIAVHPLRSIHDERAEKPGKQPVIEGHRKLKPSDCHEDFLAMYFSEGSNYNLGGIIPSHMEWVDLDAKEDQGTSARAWLAAHPEFDNYPRVSTLNGFHIPVRVSDLPPKAKTSAHKINDKLVIELLAPGNPVTLAPSLRPDEIRYRWEVTGDIPEFTWDCLHAALGIERGKKTANQPGSGGAKHQRFAGNLETLDMLTILRGEGLLGELLDEETSKWSINCPWRHEHSDQKTTPDSSTVVFVPPGKLLTFNCLHAHCRKRGTLDLCQWLEERNPGVIDEHCEKRRAYRADETESIGGLPLVLHPGPGRLISETAADLGRIIAPLHVWFNRNGNLVEVSRDTTGMGLRFREITSVTACAGIERFVLPVTIDKGDTNGNLRVPTSFDREMMAKLLAAPQFLQQLPVISRVLSSPLAIIDETTRGLVDLQPGYNPEHKLFLDPGFGPIDIVEPGEARMILNDLLGGFCFETEQDRVHALARIITPYVRQIMGWTARTPLWIYVANRPRAGKDYQAMLSFIIYEGDVCEDAPLERSHEETRKRITAALMSGRPFMHFANCQGHIDDAALTAAVTSRTIGARNLGGSGSADDLRLPNEMEFSISANVGLTFREDIGPRSRRIALAFQDEDPNSRRFRYPDLHDVVRRNRRRILGAIHALVKVWVEQGCPPGPSSFTSFPEWARVMGGIMHANGLGNPCLPHATELALGGDLKEKAMHAVYTIGFARWPDQWVIKQDLFQALAGSDDEDLNFFGSFVGEDATKTRTRAGMALTAYKGRILSGVILEVDPAGKGSQQRVRFSHHENNGVGTCETPGPDGTLGTFGTLESASGLNQNESNINETTVERDCSSGRAACRGSQGSQGSSACTLVTDRGEFPAIARQIVEAGVAALGVVAQGTVRRSVPGSRRSHVHLLLAIPSQRPWVIDLHRAGGDLGPLKVTLEATTLVMHDARPSLGILHAACGFRARQVFCTRTASKLLTNGTDVPNDLVSILHRHLGITANDNHRHSGPVTRLDAAQLAHAALDVVHLHSLRQALESDLESAGLTQVTTLEMRLIPVVVDIEAAGLPLDHAEVERHHQRATTDVERALAEMCRLANNPGLNPGSPDQVRDALALLGIDIPNTSAETLAAVGDNPFVIALMAYRRGTGTTTLLDGLVARCAGDGRLHTNLDPLGTDTGRFSSSDPCLHNIPRGEIRSVVRPPAGMVFVKADYSQIDLRAAAVLAEEQEMLRAFREGQDLHRLTAGRITGKPLDQITREERQEAKAVNFGFIYGQGVDGFRSRARADYGLNLSRERAEELRQGFFSSYPAFSEWHSQTRHAANQGLSDVRTRTGRRRLLPPELSAWDRFAQGVNTPVQGVAADGMKMALIELHCRLPEGARILLTVHDDVLVECPAEMGEDIRRLVEEVMRAEMDRLLPEVPIVVEAEILESWG